MFRIALDTVVDGITASKELHRAKTIDKALELFTLEVLRMPEHSRVILINSNNTVICKMASCHIR